MSDVPATTGAPRDPQAVRDAAALDPVTRSDFAVIVPAFDEAPVIGTCVRELREAFEALGLDGEVIVIDDGSTDGTGAAAEAAGEGWPGFRVLRHRTNLGKTEALLSGAQATERRWLVLFDADLQHLPDEIPRFLLRLQEGADIVTGRKVGAYDKKVVSSVYNGLSRRLFRVPVSDLNSMKAFRRDILDDVFLRHDWHRFFVVLAHARGWSVEEMDIALHPRRAGDSKFQGPWRIVMGVLDLISVAFLLRFAQKPLLLFGGTGAGLFALGALVGLGALYVRFVHGVGFRPVLYLVMLLLTLGTLLVGVGLLAEMIALVRDELERMRGRTGMEA